MPQSLVELLDALDELSRYDGPWRPLRRETGLLATRVAELRERQSHLDNVLVVAFVGGSGVGKSTLLNALAGDELAKTSEYRPCTDVPTVYHPPGVEFRFEGARHISGSALEHLVLVDTPDSDTIVTSHREIVMAVLNQCDLVLLCGSAEKYLDEATWSLLRPLRGERTFVCIETKASPEDSIRAHWIDRFQEAGFNVAAYFRVRALKSFDRKLAGRPPGEDEADFPALEAFLRDELNADRIARIKRSNAAGLLSKTIGRLEESVEGAKHALDAAADQVRAADREVLRETLNIIEERLFVEPHLWNYALGREMGLRAKGGVGFLYRGLEAVRGLPARVAGWLPRGAAGVGRGAASLLSSKEIFQEDLQVAGEQVAGRYAEEQSEIALALVRAGFEMQHGPANLQAFTESLNHQVSAVLRGGARDQVVRYARRLTSWPVSLLLDLPPVALGGYAAFRIVTNYFSMPPMQAGFIAQSAAVLAIILAAELVGLSLAARGAAWYARHAARNALRLALGASLRAFPSEYQIIEETRARVEQIQQLRRALND